MPSTLPPKIKVKLPGGKDYADVLRIVENNQLHTVCQSARCPNMGQCWGERTATFMLLGNLCTRSCRFCAVQFGRPAELDMGEPERVADAVHTMNLDYAVITSVNRDDVPDGGASIFAETVRCIRSLQPDCKVELLTPDFCGDMGALDVVLDAEPDVLNHNMETAPSLFESIQPWNDWEASLEVLRHAKNRGFVTKSGLIVGLGETKQEVMKAIQSIREESGCDILTIGQYLSPTRRHAKVERMVSEEEFKEYEDHATQLGYAACLSGPLVRSSFKAKWAYQAATEK